jgi:anti-anti-sigma regulatory factor
MVQVEFDKPKNLLRINYCGHVDAEQAQHGVERMAKALDGISPGFKMLADLSGLDEMDTACAKHIRKAMDLFNHKGVAQIVRIIPDPSKDIGLNILSIFHYRRGVRIVTCETMDEALAALEAGASFP